MASNHQRTPDNHAHHDHPATRSNDNNNIAQNTSNSSTTVAANDSSASSSQQDHLTPLEQRVLDEYARLLGNLNNLSDILAHLAANPTPAILDELRGLERSTSLVYTLLKASVYSIVLNLEDERAAGGG